MHMSSEPRFASTLLLLLRRCVLTPNIREFEVLLHQSREDVGAALALLDRSRDTCADELSDSQDNFLTRHFTAQELKELAEQLYATEDMGGKYAQLRALSASLGGVTVLLKGEWSATGPCCYMPWFMIMHPFFEAGKDDVVSAGGAVLEVRGEAGSPRRCGGQVGCQQ